MEIDFKCYVCKKIKPRKEFKKEDGSQSNQCQTCRDNKEQARALQDEKRRYRAAREAEILRRQAAAIGSEFQNSLNNWIRSIRK